MSYFVLSLIIWILNMSESYCDDSDPCVPGDDGIYRHPKECQLYYNCSLPYREFKPWLGKHVMECEYPDLFREETLRCESSENVECGFRILYEKACEYRNIMCQDAFCRPCMSDFSCSNNPGSINQCDYTSSLFYRKLTCRLDNHGNLKLFDASLCPPVKILAHSF